MLSLLPYVPQFQWSNVEQFLRHRWKRIHLYQSSTYVTLRLRKKRRPYNHCSRVRDTISCASISHSVGANSVRVGHEITKS